MNIIYIHTHDTGRFIEPYGYNIPTPNLMNLAKEGTLFRQAFCAAPTCSPSRAALLTGTYPHTNGMFGLAHRGFNLNDMNEHVVNLLNEKGVETVLCGIQHVVHGNLEQIGYKKIITADESNTNSSEFTSDETNAAEAAKYILKKKDKPYFLSFGMYNTHRDWPEIDNETDPNNVMPPFPIYDNDENRKDFAAYISSAKIVDRCVGTIMNALRESGAEDETFVFFTTDHGIAYPNMKCNLYDTGIGVSLIIKYPGNKKAGECVDALVSHLDIFPTVCEIMNISEPDRLTGSSLIPLMENSTDGIRDEIHAEVNFHVTYEPMRCIRTQRYKLIRYFDDYDYPLPANIDGSVAKDFLNKAGFYSRKHDKTLLFDLYQDPVERVNLADDESYLNVLKDLSARLDKWMVDTKDPILNGEIAKPEGAVINKKRCYSPRTKDYM